MQRLPGLRIRQPPEFAIGRRRQQFAGNGRRINSPAVHSLSRRCRAGKQALLYDGVDTPVAVDHLRHAEIDTDGDQ
jgi:hypothetical protein